MLGLLVLWAFLETAQSPSSFWPITGAGWVTFVGGIVAVVYLLYDRIFAKGKRDEKLSKLDETVGKVSSDALRLDQRVNDQAQAIRDISLQLGAMREGFGESRALLKEIHDSVIKSNQDAHNMIGSVRIDIARTEERLAVLGDIKEVLRETIREAATVFRRAP